MKLLKPISAAMVAAVFSVGGSGWSVYDDSDTVTPLITVTYIDGAGFGFNDATLGASRKAALEYALSLWSSKLKKTVPIAVEASCQAMGGSGVSATLASAGPKYTGSAGSGVPFTNTNYPIPLLNQYAESDLLGGADEHIQVIVNSDVDNATVLGTTDFYYGTNASPGSDIDFVTVILHELGHGFGFLTFMSQTGVWLSGRPDVFERNLIQSPGGALHLMTDAGRQAAQISGNLFWDGSSLKNRFNPNTAAIYGNVEMYAPGTYQSGSSTSHFDLGNSPDLLMEPQYAGASHTLDVTGNVLKDIGWFLDASALPVSLSHIEAE